MRRFFPSGRVSWSVGGCEKARILTMSRIFVPSKGPNDWRSLLAEPDKHWARGYSARALAHCWELAEGFPREVLRLFSQDPVLAKAEPLLIFPEWKVALPGRGHPSQNDIWVLARAEESLISITVEGKVSEPFGETIGEWRSTPSQGRISRLAYLAEVLGLDDMIPDGVRYQLLHRAVSAILEARRFGADRAIALVHSFSPTNLWFEDFSAFVALFGTEAAVDQLITVRAANGFPLLLAWVHGDEGYLEA